jgi:hypothetical protein
VALALDDFEKVQGLRDKRHVALDRSDVGFVGGEDDMKTHVILLWRGFARGHGEGDRGEVGEAEYD